MTTDDMVQDSLEFVELPEGVLLGAHDLGAGRVSFALYAPWKKSISLIIDFNPAHAEPMNHSENGVWWLIKENIEPGTYAYQFKVDDKKIIADPYSREIQSNQNGQRASLIRVGATPYQWNDEGFGIKPLNELVIYEVHVGDFSAEGTFKGLTERLPYLQDLGVTAIELMPIFEYPGDHSWGYNPAFFFAPERSYGTLDDLRELIDQAHQHGIGVILDVVFNHVDASSPINYLYSYDENPYFGDDHNPWGFPDFNHWNDACKQLMADIQTFWLLDMHIDGLRYDYAPGIGFDGENGMSFLTWHARQVKPHVYLIVEHTEDYTSLIHHTEADASWHVSFKYQMIANLNEMGQGDKAYGDMEGTMRELDFRSTGYSDTAQAINFLESHDEQRVIYEATSNPDIHPDTAHLKSKLGAIALFTATGVPMLYHGQEFGMWTERTIDQNKLQWELLETELGTDLHAFYRGMILLRNTVPALVSNNIQCLNLDNERKLLAYQRWTDDGSNRVVVVLNFGIELEYLDVPFPAHGTWHEWVYDYDHEVNEDVQAIEIPGSGGKIFVWNA